MSKTRKTKLTLTHFSLFKLSGRNVSAPYYVCLPYKVGEMNLYNCGAEVLRLLANHLGQSPEKFADRFDSIELICVSDCFVALPSKGGSDASL